MPKFSLSPSALNLFNDCPRCFWMDKVKKVKRPRGIFPSLPSGMDREIKLHFDRYRSQHCLPPELRGKQFEDTYLFDEVDLLERWRSWRTGLVVQDKSGNTLSGALDDLLVKGNLFIPFDYKTKGSPTTIEAAQRYYTNQLDCYALMMEANKLKTAGYGYLLYYSPKEVREDGNVLFELQPIKLKTDPQRAMKTFNDALKLLNGPEPKASARCEYCGWIANLKKIQK